MKVRTLILMASSAWVVAAGLAVMARVRANDISDSHQQYAGKLWIYLNRPEHPYKKWAMAKKPVEVPNAPPADGWTRSYLNPVAQQDPAMPHRSIVVNEHYDGNQKLTGISVLFRAQPGYNASTDDWYWLYFSPGGKLLTSSADKSPHARRGFYTELDDGRLWVLRTGSSDLTDFVTAGELAKNVTLPGDGPGGVTLRAPDRATAIEYLAAKDGFHTELRDDVLWVFGDDAKELVDFKAGTEPAKCVTRVGEGPLGISLRSPDSETVDAYTYTKPGCVVSVEDGRLWVFKAGSEALADWCKSGDLAKRVTQIGEGPGGITLMGPDSETLTEYKVAADGFITVVDKGGRLWVFRPGSDEYLEFQKSGEPAKRVTRIGEGPGGVTLMGPDSETLQAYLASVGGK